MKYNININKKYIVKKIKKIFFLNVKSIYTLNIMVMFKFNIKLLYFLGSNVVVNNIYCITTGNIKLFADNKLVGGMICDP